MSDDINHTLGRILATLEAIKDDLEKVDKRHEKIEERITVVEKAYYKSVGFISFVTFTITMSGQYFWDRMFK